MSKVVIKKKFWIISIIISVFLCLNIIINKQVSFYEKIIELVLVFMFGIPSFAASINNIWNILRRNKADVWIGTIGSDVPGRKMDLEEAIIFPTLLSIMMIFVSIY